MNLFANFSPATQCLRSAPQLQASASLIARSNASHAIIFEWVKCARLTADFPDSVSGFASWIPEISSAFLQRPIGFIVSNSRDLSAMHRRQDFAINVDLKLLRSRVADSHRL